MLVVRGPDVDAQRQERLVVDLDGDPRPSDGSRDGEVGPLPRTPASSRAVTWRFTVAMLRPVV